MSQSQSQSALPKIEKRGFAIPISFEMLLGAKPGGHYVQKVPTWHQWGRLADYALGWLVFHAAEGLRKWSERFRHTSRAGGWEYEHAEYRKFEPKRVWVKDETKEEE